MMAAKGQSVKFDEFAIVMLGAVIFLGILLLAFNTPTEFPPRVSPDSFSFELGPGNVQQFSLNISGGITQANISTSGEVGRWITVPQTDLGVLRDRTIVTLTLTVPTAATAGTHTGTITVRSKEGRSDVAVSVFVNPLQQLTSRSLQMGDFSVKYLSGTSVLDTEEEAVITRSYLGERRVNLIGIVPEDEAPLASSGHVRFIVEDANNYGPLVVTQNGVDIFREYVGPGEVVVPLNASNIVRSNAVSIRSDTPGIFFWAENVHVIRDAELVVSFEGSATKKFNFEALQDEISKFDHIQLTFVGSSESRNIPALRISVNGQTVHQSSPAIGLFNRNFNRDVQGRPISLGDVNTIEFSFDQPASLQIGNAVLTVFRRA